MDLPGSRAGGQERNGRLSPVCGLNPGPMPVSPINLIRPVILVQHLPPHPPVSAMSCSVLNPRANQNTCWETEVDWGGQGWMGSWDRRGKGDTKALEFA